MVKLKDMQFFMENLKMNRKRTNIFLTFPERGFEPQIFSNFPTHDLNFHGREGDKFKSKQASKRERTLNSLPRSCAHIIKSHLLDLSVAD